MRSYKHVEIISHLTPKAAARYWAYVDKSAGEDACWLWTGSRRKQGYGRFKLLVGIVVSAHRVAYALGTGQDPGGLFVCHRCDNPRCVNHAHLWLGTGDDNMADMVQKGRSAGGGLPGEDNQAAKLTASQVEFIKRQIVAGRKNKEIAAAFGVTHSLISRIRLGKAWGTVPLTARYRSLKSA